MRTPAIAALAIATAFGLAACTTTDEKPDPIDTALSQQILKEAGPSGGLPPAPDAAHRAGYLEAVHAAVPGLGITDDSAVFLGRDICQAYTFSEAFDVILKQTLDRLRTDDQPVVSTEANDVMAAAQKYICP